MATQAKPIISWWWDWLDVDVKKFDYVGQKSGVGTKNLWDLGTVRAGNEATVDETLQTFYIWNNKGGSDVVQNMTNCELTVRDGNYPDGSYQEGTANSPLVTERWVEARSFKSVKDSTGTETPSAWTGIGLDISGQIAKIDFEALGDGTTSSVDSFGANEISGAINTGAFDSETDKNNYAKIQLRLKVPAAAEAGEVAFIARIYYSSRVV